MPKEYPIYICPSDSEANVFAENTCNEQYIFDNEDEFKTNSNTIKLLQTATTLASALDLLKPHLNSPNEHTNAYWAKSVSVSDATNNTKTKLQKSSFSANAIVIKLDRKIFETLKEKVTCENENSKFKCELKEETSNKDNFGFDDVYTQDFNLTDTNTNRNSLLAHYQIPSPSTSVPSPSKMGGKRHQRKTKRRKHNKRKSHFKRK